MSFVIGVIMSFTMAANELDIRELDSDLELVDVDGNRHAVSIGGDTKACVLAWTSADCPMSKVYAPRVETLAKKYADRGVPFFFIDSSS